MKKIHTMLLSLLMATSVDAALLDAATLRRALLGKDPTELSIAIGYVAGAYDAGLNIVHCAPPFDPRSLVQMVLRAMEEEPDQMNQPGDYFIIVPLQKAFPCPSKTSI